jgi:carboxylesterase
MPQPESLDPSAYVAEGGPVGVLLLHGLGGSAAETRPMGEYLAEQGMTVRCPLLSGHGTSPEDLIGIRWRVWADEAESALHGLQRQCDTVFVAGLSMGALLALWLGVSHPEVVGLVPMSPFTKLQMGPVWPIVGLRYVLKYPPPGIVATEALGDPEAIHRLWCYDKQSLWGVAEAYLLQRRVRKALAGISQPILIWQGRLDNWLSPLAGQIIYDNVASTDRTMVWLEQSGHNVLVDGERNLVWTQSYEWMMRISGAAAPR